MSSRTRVLTLLLPMVLAACATGAPPIASPSASTGSATAAPGLTPVPGGPAASGAPGAGLDPTEAELMLLKGMRLDLRGACGPFRDKLPAGAVGEVACVPASGAARFVEVALFDTQDAMLRAYFDRLGQAGVTPQTNGGACADAPTAEGAWVPGPDDGNALPERGACWVDADAAPVYLATQPPFVLITVTGQPDAAPDTAHQYAWAGNEDVPGAPTIWREIAVDAAK